MESTHTLSLRAGFAPKQFVLLSIISNYSLLEFHTVPMHLDIILCTAGNLDKEAFPPVFRQKGLLDACIQV
ncbi:MAG TPA: hypothetical protein DEV98_04605 [Clostridiales bacterium]|nr:hypothetical protein [Clostridiales bacterium]